MFIRLTSFRWNEQKYCYYFTILRELPLKNLVNACTCPAIKYDVTCVQFYALRVRWITAGAQRNLHWQWTCAAIFLLFSDYVLLDFCRERTTTSRERRANNCILLFFFVCVPRCCVWNTRIYLIARIKMAAAAAAAAAEIMQWSV